MYVGGVLFINGIGLLGKITPREMAVMNVFTGTIAFLVCIHNALSVGSDEAVQAGAYGLLFAFTYLWVAYNNLTDQDGRGLGWFSFFVAITASAIAWDQYSQSSTFWDYWLSLSWAAWAALWFSFFVLGVYKPASLVRPVAIFTILQAIATAWLPGYLLLSGHMPG
jgi:putative amide transporter protein